jgi:hypothetical protein
MALAPCTSCRRGHPPVQGATDSGACASSRNATWHRHEQVKRCSAWPVVTRLRSLARYPLPLRLLRRPAPAPPARPTLPEAVAANGGDDAGDVDDQLPAQQRDMAAPLNVADAEGPDSRQPAQGQVGQGIARLHRGRHVATTGVSLAIALALPAGILASGVLVRKPTLRFLSSGVVRAVLGVLRAIHELVWALLFMAAIGLSPFAAVLALAPKAAACRLA